MALEGQERIVAIHAAAVVGDADETAASSLDLDANAGGARVERVLKQFFDHRSGPVNNFSGGDLVRHLVGKNPDLPHRKSG